MTIWLTFTSERKAANISSSTYYLSKEKKLNIVLINYLPWGFISNLEIKLFFASVRFVKFISLSFHAILWRQLETNPSQSTRDLWRRHQSERKILSSRGIR